MKHAIANLRGQTSTRRAFLKQVLALTSVSAGTALLAACSPPSGPTTAVPPAATTGAASMATTGTTPTGEATVGVESTATTGITSTNEMTTGTVTSIEAVTSTTEGATPTSTGQNATPNIVAAANAFLATLSDAEKETVLFDWTDTEQKQRWSNFPEGAFDHAGLMMGNMTEPQQSACLAVLQAILSTEGYNRVVAEWQADGALTDTGGGGASFGTAYYFVAIIGTPSETDPWQWQWGGHHITINATLVGPNISLTPSFIGVQPFEYTNASGATVRPLADIENDAFALMTSLDAAQQQTAILGTGPINLVLGPGQDSKTLPPEGLPASQMTADQQAAFLKLIGHYTGLVNDGPAAARLAEVQTTLDQTYLAWYGSTTQGNPAYFRVTGPTLVIEYSPQGERGQVASTQTTDYHIHGIYRDPTNDYGAKLTS